MEFRFTGRWNRWKNPETGKPVISCTIIVTDANALTRPIHMPVVLDKVDIGPWRNGEAVTELLTPAAEDHLRMWPVSRRVNKTGSGDDDPTLIDEVAVIEFAILSVGAAVGKPDRSPCRARARSVLCAVNIGDGNGYRYREVVQSDKGIWVHSAF
jgi:hypothetical protein